MDFRVLPALQLGRQNLIAKSRLWNKSTHGFDVSSIGLYSRAGGEEPSEVGSREFGSIKHLEEHRGQQGNGGAHHPVVQFECSADIRELFLDIGA